MVGGRRDFSTELLLIANRIVRLNRDDLVREVEEAPHLDRLFEEVEGSNVPLGLKAFLGPGQGLALQGLLDGSPWAPS